VLLPDPDGSAGLLLLVLFPVPDGSGAVLFPEPVSGVVLLPFPPSEPDEPGMGELGLLPEPFLSGRLRPPEGGVCFPVSPDSPAGDEVGGSG